MNGHGAEGRAERSFGRGRGRVIYVRKQEDAETLWQRNDTTTGINFSKYDKVPVSVRGENIPQAIAKFEEAGLSSVLSSNIRRAGFETPTPVQKHGIPILMAARDLMACARTGSGKTAAFLFPIITGLSGSKSQGKEGLQVTPQVVVMVPVRELALQIYQEGVKFCGGTGLTCQVVYGGESAREQLIRLGGGCNILVATVGRLKDFVERGRISFKSIRYLVLDEADRMLEMGFREDIETLIKRMPQQCLQTMMFSATFPKDIQELARKYLHNDHIFLQFGEEGSACENVRQMFEDMSGKNRVEKTEFLVEMLKKQRNNNYEKTLIFVEQKKYADFLALNLCQEELPATTMHGDRAQEERETALNDFKTGFKPILVATAVAARGLHIAGITHVINFEMPSTIEEYIHR